MTEHDSGARHASTRQGIRRRRFLSGVGASGLATAMAVFGRPTPAEALVSAACCHLCKSPSGTITGCQTATHYVWNCRFTSTVGCSCCERGNSAGGCSGVVQSAYHCSHV